MKKVQCKIHKTEFQLPTTEDEFLSGELHDQVVAIEEHSDNKKCRFEKVEK